jgi:hypothetical protein
LVVLFVGVSRPHGELADCQIGPFRVKLIDDYPTAAARVSQSGKVKVEFAPDDSGQLQKHIHRIPATIGEWVVCAAAECDDASGEQSILGRDPIDDHGVFDLCQLLTFITGRTVTTEEFADRHNPKTKGESFCPPELTLPVAAQAWSNRTALLSKKCQYALLSHNSAFDTWGLQGLASYYNTALNVLLDQWDIATTSVAKAVREALRTRVQDAVDVTQELANELREPYKAILGARVMQGPFSLIDELIALLKDLALVPASPSADVSRRIQFVNAVRNKLTHSGQIPELKGMDRGQSDRYCMTIVGGIVPEINRQALGRLLGFSADTHVWLAQERKALQRFFAEGVWQKWPLETAEFHEWIESIDIDSFFRAIGG